MSEYESYHNQPPVAVRESIVAAGILKMKIFRVSIRFLCSW
ncbi:hypothetical protein ACUN24_09555 [Pedobacter sp. WC2501]